MLRLTGKAGWLAFGETWTLLRRRRYQMKKVAIARTTKMTVTLTPAAIALSEAIWSPRRRISTVLPRESKVDGTLTVVSEGQSKGRW